MLIPNRKHGLVMKPKIKNHHHNGWTSPV